HPLHLPPAVPPRDAPSLPTRRSSDLVVYRPAPLTTARPRLGLSSRATDGDACERARAQPYGFLSSTAACSCRSTSSSRRSSSPSDRKSTRLNSSHVSISYAVFCLKKK